MNLIYIGSFYPENRRNEIRINSKIGLDNASNVHQNAILKGLDYFYNNLIVITVPTIKSYPFNYKRIRFKSSHFSHNDKSNDYCVGFLNIPIIKHYSKYINLRNQIKRLLKTNEKTLIIIYSIHSPFLKAIYKFVKKNNNIKTCLIVPDLPQFMSESENLLYKLLKKIDIYFINRYLKKIDSYVVLTDSMLEMLPADNKFWVKIEGIYDGTVTEISEMTDTLKVSDNLIIITYTGTLDYRYGIENLLSAFSSINDPNYRLWICGAGNSRKRIIEMATIDPRIVYWGELTFEEVKKMHTKSTLLINPRTSNGEYTKYSFPSKTMEYMASKTPCIMHRLPGIPEEYFDYVYLAERQDAQGLKDTIMKVSIKDKVELKQFGENAANFIANNKNPLVQVEKIYNMIEKMQSYVQK